MFSTFAVLLLCVIGALCAEPQYVGKLPDKTRIRSSVNIYNGNKTSIAKYPYIASLEQYGTEYGAAVILDKNWLLTTGWNVAWCSASDLTFRVGSTNYDKGGQVLKASKVIVHPKYTGDGWDYDIAVVKTDKPIKFGKKVKPIALATKKLKAGTKGWSAGWGYFDSSSTVSEVLMEAQVTAYSWKSCETTYSSYLTKRLMCTLDTDVAACPYDFGDPIEMDNAVCGLYAGGYSCTPNAYPQLYTDIPSLYKWVNSTIKSEQVDSEIMFK